MKVSKTSIKFSAFIIIFLSLLFWQKQPVFAQSCDEQHNCEKYQDDEEKKDKYTSCLNDLRSCWESKISQAKTQANTLQSTINILNGQIQLQAIKIQQTSNEIQQLEKEITELTQRIEGLSISLDKLSGILIEKVRASYKQSRTQFKINLFTNDSFNDFVSQYRYLNIAQEQTLEVMRRTELQRATYDQQKTLKEEKQEEVNVKKIDLEKQKAELDAQKSAKNNLLTETKNNEAVYQQKLSEALAELNSLKAFSSSKSGSTLPEQRSPDGWFFSQRDQRWANQLIGRSNMSIMEVGCLISSTAMMMKKFGANVNPITIANNSSYFFSNTAYMSRPWPTPAGYSYQYSTYSQSDLDSKLKKNPVIVKLASGPYGTHFIVIKEKKNDQYIIHDPWEGYDKKFSDFYSVSQILQVASLVKN